MNKLFILLALCAGFCSASLAQAEERAAPESVTYGCLVYGRSGPENPSFLANKKVTVAEGETKVVYSGKGLVYSFTYQIMGKGEPQFELPMVELRLKNLRKNWEIRVSAGVGADWRHNVILEPPFGLPEFSCSPQ